MKDDILQILWRLPDGLTLARHLLRAQLQAQSGIAPGEGELNTALAEMVRDGWVVETRNRRTGDAELALTALGREVFSGAPAKPAKPKAPLRLRERERD